MSVSSTATPDGEAANVGFSPASDRSLAVWSEEQLMAAMARGDERALGELYDRVASVAYGLALRVLSDRELAEDALQEGFLSVWRAAASFDRSRGSARSWILMLVHRRAVDLVKRNQRLRGLESDLMLPELLSPSLAEASELDADRREVQVALASLPEKQRTVLGLAYFAGYTQQEILASLEAPLGTIKSQTFEGLRRLRQLLEPTLGRPA